MLNYEEPSFVIEEKFLDVDEFIVSQQLRCELVVVIYPVTRYQTTSMLPPAP
jgi:hypothetical protein